jgi:hypothetical protein
MESRREVSLDNNGLGKAWWITLGKGELKGHSYNCNNIKLLLHP